MNIDLGGAKLEVIQTLQRVKGRLQFVWPKANESERTVPLPSICVETLRAHRKQQLAERSDRIYPVPDHERWSRDPHRSQPIDRRTFHNGMYGVADFLDKLKEVIEQEFLYRAHYGDDWADDSGEED